MGGVARHLPLRHRRHWVLIRSLRGGQPVDRFLRSGAGELSHWVDAMARTWTDEGRSTLVAVQADGDEGAGREGVGSWHESGRSVAVVRGQVRWFGEPWQPPERWPARILTNWVTHPGHPLEGTAGDATVACVDGQGQGVVAADDFGSSSAYYHLGSDLLVASSRPSLVARVLELVGRPPRADLYGLAWLARAGYQVGGATAYEGVTRLPIAARLVLARGGGATLVEPAVPWADHAPLGSRTEQEVCDVVEAVVADHLQAAVGLGRRLILDLTGGKDSRLVLAVARSVLDPESYLLRTVGPASSPDVQLSAQIAALLGLEHESGFPRPRTPGSFAEHVEGFLDRTDGSLTAWVASVPHPFEPEVRISGVSGEMYRVGMYETSLIDAGPERWSPNPQEATDTIDEIYSRGLRDDIVLPACADHLRADLLAYFQHIDRIGTPSDQLVYRYFAGYHNRVATGELLDLEADHRILPLVDVRGVRALAGLPQTARYREVVHLGLISRLAPQLLEVPLAGGAWRADPPRWASGSLLGAPGPGALADDQASVHEAPTAVLEPPATTTEPVKAGVPSRPTGQPAPAWPVLAIAKAGPDQERQSYLADALADPPSAVWALFDRSVVQDLLDRFDAMPMRSRKQIYAAATAARWLARVGYPNEPGPLDREKAGTPPTGAVLGDTDDRGRWGYRPARMLACMRSLVPMRWRRSTWPRPSRSED